MRQETAEKFKDGTQDEKIRREWKKLELSYFGDGNGGPLTPAQAYAKYQESRPNLKGEMYDHIEKTLDVPRATIRRVVNSFDTYFVKANNKYQFALKRE